MWQITLTGQGPQIRPGFSGGPITHVSGNGECLLGMLVSVDEAQQAAWMLPADALRRVWARLRELCLDLVTEDDRLRVLPGGAATKAGSTQPPAGQPTTEQAKPADLAELAKAAENDNGTALYQALFGASAHPDTQLIAIDLGTDQDHGGLDHPALGHKRLRLRCHDAAAAALPWHRCTGPDGRSLTDQGWVIEVTGPEPRPHRHRRIDTALILAPADDRLAPGVRRHVEQVAAAIAPLQTNPRAAVKRAISLLDLRALLRLEPDLVYCYARLDPSGRLQLGHDPESVEFATLNDLLDALAALPLPPLLWLHCIEHDQTAPSQRSLDQHHLIQRAERFPLLVFQRVPAGERPGRSLNATLSWLGALGPVPPKKDTPADPIPVDPAAVLGRHADHHCWLRLGQDGLTLSCPARPDDILYSRIYAALIQLLLGRTAEKDLLDARIRGTAKPLLTYFVCGDHRACVHDFPDQARWHLHGGKPRNLSLRQRPIPLRLREDTDLAKHQRLLWEELQFNPDQETPEAALLRIAQVEPSSEAPIVISLAWLLEPDPALTPQQVAELLPRVIGDWMRHWKEALLDCFRDGDIPAGLRVLAGVCLQWRGDPTEAATADAAATSTTREISTQATPDAAEIQRRALAVVQRRNPAHCDWVRIERPLDRLNLSDLETFFTDEQHRLLRDCMQGQGPIDLAERVMDRTDGRFLDTVDCIHRGCKGSFDDLDPAVQAQAPGATPAP